MKLAKNNELLAEHKGLILYILNKVNKPLTSDALLKIILSVTDMNYFYFQQFLLDLTNNKYIMTLEEDENLYIITDTGKEVLELTENIIPGIFKFRLDNNLKENLEVIKDELSVTSEFIPESEKEYSVKCKIVENNRTLFEVHTFAGSREQAKIIADNWKQNAEKIYPQLLEILTRTDF